MKNFPKERLDGFTLMELLVVVLVIGVLAAAAVPQYQRSVDKSRYSTLMPVAASVRNAQETFYMASAAYSPDLSGLDVSLPGEINGSRAELGNGVKVEVSAENGNGFVSASKEGLDNKYVMYFANSANFPKEVHCEALSSSDRAKKLCTGLGGRELGAAGNYTKYVLEGAGAGRVSEAESGTGGTSSGEGSESAQPADEEAPASSAGFTLSTFGDALEKAYGDNLIKLTRTGVSYSGSSEAYLLEGKGCLWRDGSGSCSFTVYQDPSSGLFVQRDVGARGTDYDGYNYSVFYNADGSFHSATKCRDGSCSQLQIKDIPSRFSVLPQN